MLEYRVDEKKMQIVLENEFLKVIFQGNQKAFQKFSLYSKMENDRIYKLGECRWLGAVSYTHLTLPTN